MTVKERLSEYGGFLHVGILNRLWLTGDPPVPRARRHDLDIDRATALVSGARWRPRAPVRARA